MCCRFLCFYIILFLVHQTAVAMFRVIAALLRNIVLATALGSLFLVIYLMLSGFILAQRARHGSSFMTTSKFLLTVVS